MPGRVYKVSYSHKFPGCLTDRWGWKLLAREEIVTKRVRPSQDRSGLEIYETALEYGDGLEEGVTIAVIKLLCDPERARQQMYAAYSPYLILALVDSVVRYVANNHRRSPSYWGAKFTVRENKSSDPFESRTYKVLETPTLAMNFYSILRTFYTLLRNPEYWSSQYCVNIEVAREALQFAYPHEFIELPLINYECPEDVSRDEFNEAIAQLAWPAVERYHQAMDKIAEIVAMNDYRSRQARELSKIRLRANSASSLINGLLNHHTRLTVVAIRLSIRQASALDYLGERVQKAFGRLIDNRRNDVFLKSAIGYVWVRQESFRASLRRRLHAPGEQDVTGGIALHYDLILFFDVGRHAEVSAITEHIRGRWKKVTNNAGYCRSLSKSTATPYLSRSLLRAMEHVGRLPDNEDFVGVVTKGSARANNLVKFAKMMVVSATLRKPGRESASPTLIHNKTRRFATSDLLTGCGYTKEGRGTKKGHSGLKFERVKRLPYGK